MAIPEDLIDKIFSLSLTDKAELVDQLLCSIDNIGKDVEAKWTIEVESRLNAYIAGKLETVLLEDVIAKYKR